MHILQLLTLRLTLDGFTIVQQAYPTPPIGDLPLMHFRIEWKELLSGSSGEAALRCLASRGADRMAGGSDST